MVVHYQNPHTPSSACGAPRSQEKTKVKGAERSNVDVGVSTFARIVGVSTIERNVGASTIELGKGSDWQECLFHVEQRNAGREIVVSRETAIFESAAEQKSLFHVEQWFCFTWNTAKCLFHVKHYGVRTCSEFETAEHSKRQGVRIGSAFERKSGLAEVVAKIN